MSEPQMEKKEEKVGIWGAIAGAFVLGFFGLAWIGDGLSGVGDKTEYVVPGIKEGMAGLSIVVTLLGCAAVLVAVGLLCYAVVQVVRNLLRTLRKPV